MFKPAPMKRLRLVALERDGRAVLRAMGYLGAVELVRTTCAPDTAPLAPRDRREELARIDRLLARVRELRRSLEILPSSKAAAPTGITLNQAEENLRTMEEQAEGLLKDREHLMQRWRELTGVCERVSSYCGLEIPLDAPDRFSFLHFMTGTLPKENLENLQNQVPDNVTLLPLSERKNRQSLIAITTRQGRQVLEKALQQADFQPDTLPTVEGTTVDMLSGESEREKGEVEAELGQLDAKMQSLAAEFRGSLADIERLVDIERRLLEAAQNCPRTEAAILLTGWVPAHEATRLEQRVRDVTGGRCAIDTATAEELTEEQVPVLLRHPRLLRPFEMLVSAYGVPNYRELEPTLFVALSYLLMFGIMFGDAGHGGVLTIGGLILLFSGRGEKVRDAGLLLLLGGVSSMVFGFVYGSCFGLSSFKKYALWHDPLEGDPMRLMYVAIGVGIVMISLGLILNIINRFRRGDVIGGFLDKFGLVGLLFYWGALGLMIKGSVIRSWGLVNLAVVLFLVLPIVGWMLKEPIEYFMNRRAGRSFEPAYGLVSAMTESFVGAFEAVLSYLANTISFVRLAAYAMSHAALLVAAFMMAAEVRHFSVGGSLWSVLIIILGNLVAIILEGIIASVQALRLEYYEFFGKFFSGNGRPFEPFRLAVDSRASTL